jgi:hypothetical protein
MLKSKVKNNIIFQQYNNNYLFKQQREKQEKQEKKYKHAETKESTFITTQNIITGCSLDMSPGIWSITFAFELSTKSTRGDGLHSNITYGISKNQSFDIIKINDLYNIFYDDVTTYQSYYRNFIHTFDKNETIYLHAFLNNPYELVDIYMKNSSITAILISQ